MLIDMLRDIEKKAEPAAAPDRGDLAHVQPSDLLSDTVGQDEAESTLARPAGGNLSEVARTTSSGYVRSKLTVLHGGASRASMAEFDGALAVSAAPEANHANEPKPIPEALMAYLSQESLDELATHGVDTAKLQDLFGAPFATQRAFFYRLREVLGIKKDKFSLSPWPRPTYRR